MTTPSEVGPVEREEQLVKLRRRMGKALRRGEMAEYDRLSALYARQKGEHVTRTHEEYVAERRAVRVAERAQQVQVAPRRWKLPARFGTSPLARERAREGRPEVPVIPVGRPALSPWRRRNPASEVIWRPGR
jgi:crotonobetainyl-CoA:carnitine CoA-transferase CaiB-like acyl-CoA transferase